MKRLALILFATLLKVAAAFAQENSDEHSAHHTAAPAAAPASMIAIGSVCLIQKDTNRIALDHGKIRNLDMPMAMVLNVRGWKMLDEVTVGDKMLFAAENVADGALFVTKTRPPR